ncbi:MAG: hypothetical protein R2688_02620 [Fimbriimonadaceae bacterium]
MAYVAPNQQLLAVFNAAPYELVTDSVKSVGGQTVPVHYYVLPENKEKAGS